jgi:hypothetical protein
MLAAAEEASSPVKDYPKKGCYALVVREPVQFFAQFNHATHHNQRRAFYLLRQFT